MEAGRLRSNDGDADMAGPVGSSETVSNDGLLAPQ